MDMQQREEGAGVTRVGLAKADSRAALSKGN